MKKIVKTATWSRDVHHETRGMWVLVRFKRGSTSVFSLSFCNANVFLFNSDLMLYSTFGLS
jgi:hypothetical protein